MSFKVTYGTEAAGSFRLGILLRGTCNKIKQQQEVKSKSKRLGVGLPIISLFAYILSMF